MPRRGDGPRPRRTLAPKGSSAAAESTSDSKRIAHNRKVTLDRSPRSVIRENLHTTTSGNYHTPSLLGAMLELGSDRVMFSSDYPFERMPDAADWFDAPAISARPTR